MYIKSSSISLISSSYWIPIYWKNSKYNWYFHKISFYCCLEMSNTWRLYISLSLCYWLIILSTDICWSYVSSCTGWCISRSALSSGCYLFNTIYLLILVHSPSMIASLHSVVSPSRWVFILRSYYIKLIISGLFYTSLFSRNLVMLLHQYPTFLFFFCLRVIGSLIRSVDWNLVLTIFANSSHICM